MSVKRIWHGWTTLENANVYQQLLHTQILPGIAAKQISGYRSVELLRHDHENEVEFVTVMTFDALQNVIDFQGENYQQAYVPDIAQQVLKRWDKVAAHYDIMEIQTY
ncbi:MAG: antibiotic biosynthesis monooxygenase [Rhodothermales bacterium]